ncbi:MAG: NAD(P)H-hydrate dehydratase [Bacteroidaceae bacterium]
MTDQMTSINLSKMLRKRPEEAHKGTLGHALLVAGRLDVGGCAVLAAESCMRAGVGKLSVCTPECNRLLVQLSVPEAILQIPSPQGTLSCSYEAGSSAPWQAIGIGPGIGLDSGALLHDVLDTWSTLPMVVDADALRILAAHPQWMASLSGHAVLTPHGGEMAALARGILSEELSCDDSQGLQRAAEHLSREYQVWVVLKGHLSRVYHPDGLVSICPRGNAGMATAGSGDVLTGIIAGLLAQGYDLPQASCLGVWLHASAGDEAARRLGQEAMLARDIIAHLSYAWKELHEIRNQK